jgi:hypothetical protein
MAVQHWSASLGAQQQQRQPKPTGLSWSSHKGTFHCNADWFGSAWQIQWLSVGSTNNINTHAMLLLVLYTGGRTDLYGLQRWLTKHGQSMPVLKICSGLSSSSLSLSQLPGSRLQELVLHGCKLLLPTTPHGVAPGSSSSSSSIVSGLSLANQLSSVDIQHCTLKVDVSDALLVPVVAGQFLSALSALPALQQLNLCSNMVQGRGPAPVTAPLQVPGSFLQPLQQLRRLDLQQQLTSGREVLQHLGRLTKLQHLRLAGHCPSYSAPLRLCDADFGDLSALSGLQRLQLHNVSLREDAAPQAGVVAAGVVNFIGQPFVAAAAAHERGAGLMSWLQQQQELTYLELRGVEGLDNEYARLDSTILQEGVQYLPPATHRALTSSSVLQHLDLRNTYLGIDAYQRAFPALRKVPSVTCLLLPGDMCVKLPGNSSCRSVGCTWSTPSAILGCPNLRSIEVQGPNSYTAIFQELVKQVNVTSLTLTYSLGDRLRMVPAWGKQVNGVAGMTQLLRLNLPAYEVCVHTLIYYTSL